MTPDELVPEAVCDLSHKELELDSLVNRTKHEEHPWNVYLLESLPSMVTRLE